MTGSWALSDRFTDFLSELLKASDFALSASKYHPFVGWSLGGEMQGPDGAVTIVPARYEIGFTGRTDTPADKIRIASKRFGYVILDPRPEDARSSRRLIDFDGKQIVVR